MADLDFFDSPSDNLAPLDFFQNDAAGSQVNGPALSRLDPDSPMSKFMEGGGIVTGPGEASSFNQAVASLPTDLAARAKYYASQRFPNDPAAITRYGVQDGKIYYVDDQGQGHFEESEMRLPTSVADIPEAAAEGGKAIAGSAGPALPVIAGTAGGILTAGAAGGVPGAAAGGAAGDVVRQGAAYLATGEEKSVIDRLMQTGGAALQEGAGQAIGLGVAKAVSGLGRTPVYDIPSATKTGDMAKALDIPLTAGEQTGSKALLSRQARLGMTTQGEDIFENFYRIRNDKVRAATYKILDALSPEKSVMEASDAGVRGAQSAVGFERKALQRAARPYYEAAEQVSDVNVKPVLDLIDDKMTKVAAPVAAKLRRVRADLVTKEGDELLPDGRLVKIDEVKKWLDDEIASAGRKDSGIGTAQKHHLEEVRKLLVGQADEASDAYATARGIYEAGMPSAAKVEQGMTGKIAKLQYDDVIKATRTMFSPRLSSPESIRIARLAFNKAGKQQEWNALTRAYIQDTLESIPESAVGNPTNLGGTVFKALYGSPKKVAMLREALEGTPGTLKDVEYLMQVLQASGKAAKGQSWTVFADRGMKELAKESKPGALAMAETVQVWKQPARFFQWWADMAEGKYARRMSEILTSPEGITKLRELRKLSPASAGAIIGFAHLITAEGVAQAKEVVTSDRPVGSFAAPASQQQP